MESLEGHFSVCGVSVTPSGSLNYPNALHSGTALQVLFLRRLWYDRPEHL